MRRKSKKLPSQSKYKDTFEASLLKKLCGGARTKQTRPTLRNFLGIFVHEIKINEIIPDLENMRIYEDQKYWW